MLIWSYLTWSNLIASKLYLSIDLSIYLSSIYICLSVCLSIYRSIYLLASETKQFCETSSKWMRAQLLNEAILRDFLKKCKFTAPKRWHSARLPHFLHLKTSKTKQIEAILKEFDQKWIVECRTGGLVPMRFAIVSVHVEKVHAASRGYGTKRIWR